MSVGHGVITGVVVVVGIGVRADDDDVTILVIVTLAPVVGNSYGCMVNPVSVHVCVSVTEGSQSFE